MNAGLSNLATLKAWLLAPAMQAATDYYQQILAIGRGIRGRFEQHCNRKLLRLAGEVEYFPADRTKHVVARYPIETITKIEVQQTLADSWAELENSGLLVNQLNSAGLLYFYGQQGWQRGMMRVTYTGGYFIEELEPTDEHFPTAAPTGSTAMPDELLLAWQLQCEHAWTQRDKLGLALAEHPRAHRGVLPALSALELLPDVQALLRSYIRYQMA